MAISVGIGIEGEKQFKAAISDINKNLAVLSSEMTKVTAAYDANDQSVDALRSKQSVYNKQIAEQKNKIDTLKQALVNSANEYGENSTQARNWQIALNKAEAELSKTERALKETTEATDDFGKSADDGGAKFEKLGRVLKGTAVAIAAVSAAAAAAAVALGKAVIGAYGDYEQLVGGVDTLFKDSSKQVQDYANNAFKTAGLTANEYLETVTSFSASLIQSLGGDTEKAAKYADIAITDMSDNANKMGTDMASIQNAYQGFAKQNYTMLDNLKLGYGGTKTEMERLLKDAGKIAGVEFDISSYADVVEAIHVMQESMGIAGTTAKEAEKTIQGSIKAMSGAWGNMLVGFGNADADMAALTGMLVESFQNVVANITPVIDNIAKALPEAFGAALGALSELLPTLLNTVTSLFQEVLSTLLQILPELIPVAVEALITIAGALTDNLPLIITAAVTLITTLVQGIGMALPQLIPATIAAIEQIVFGLIDNLPMLLDAALQLVLGLAQGILDALPELIAAMPEIIIGIVDFLIGSLPQIIDAGVKLLTSLVADMPTIIVEIVKALPQIIIAIVKGIIAGVPALISAGGDLIRGLWQGIANMGTWLWEKVKGFFKGITDKIKDFFGIKSPSRVFAGLGKMIPAGFAVGVKEAMPQAISDIEAQFAGVTANVSPDVRMIGGAAAGGNVVNIYPQSMTEAQFDYIYAKMNARLAT